MFLTLITWICALFFSLLFLRRFRHRSFRRDRPYSPVRTVVVLGSGGHTMEMLSLVRQLDKGEFAPRCYLVAEGDFLSVSKANEAEQGTEPPLICVVPRSRQVKQSYVTSVYTTLRSFVSCFPLLLRQRPELLLCNGPGTCVPVCFCALLLDLVLIRTCCIVYVESICRVKTLSLSAKILYHLRMADSLLVQWPELLEHYPKALYLGRF